MKQIINERTTEKYRYWTEITEATEIYYQIHCKPYIDHLGRRQRERIDCAIYHSLEEATANIHSAAALWRWDEANAYVQEKTRQVVIVKNRRSKVKG